MHKAIKIQFSLLIMFSLVACASGRRTTLGPYELVVDMKGVNASAYALDLAECQDYVEQVSVAENAAIGAAGGAVVGGVLGAVLGDSDLAKRTAGAGAVTGAVQGGGSANAERRKILRNCLIGRGYKVLN